MNDVPLNHHPCAAIYVNTIRILLVTIGRVTARSNIVHQVLAHDSVTCLVHGWVWRRPLKTDDIDSDVVVVVDDIVGDAEVPYVPVHHQRFAGTRLEVMDLVAVNYQFTDRSFSVGAVDGDAKSAAASPRSITSLKILLNVMDVVVQQLYMRAGACDADAQGSEPMFRG